MRRLGPGEYDRAAAVFLSTSCRGIAGLTEETLRRMLQNELVYVLMGDPGCAFIFHQLAGKAYQAHQAALPVARGKRMQTAARNAIAWMFRHTEAQALVGIVPADNRPSLCMAYLGGLKKIGEIPGVLVITAINRATPSRGPDGGGE